MAWENILPCVHLDKKWRITLPVMVHRHFTDEYVRIRIDRAGKRKRVGFIIYQADKAKDTMLCKVAKDGRRYRINLTRPVISKLDLILEIHGGKYYDLTYASDGALGVDLLVVDFSRPCD